MTIVKSISTTGACIVTRHATPESAELERRSRAWCGHININVLDATPSDTPVVEAGTATLQRKAQAAR